MNPAAQVNQKARPRLCPDDPAALGEWHRAMGQLIMADEGKLERSSGDGIMVFFNDPVCVPGEPQRAARMALDMPHEMVALSQGWRHPVVNAPGGCTGKRIRD